MRLPDRTVWELSTVHLIEVELALSELKPARAQSVISERKNESGRDYCFFTTYIHEEK
jgi:hypothetical protein